MVRGPPGLAHSRRRSIAWRGRCGPPPAGVLRKLLLSLALGTRRSLLLPAPAASSRRAPLLRPPSSASGPGVGSRSGTGGWARDAGHQAAREGAGRGNEGGGVRDAEAPVVESPVLRTGLIDYFLLKDPVGGGAT